MAEQTQALNECEQAAQALSELAEDLKNSTDVAKSAEQVASSAEELSSAVQEINRSSAQIMAALNLIKKSAEVQSSAAEESSAATNQIEKGAEVGQKRSTASAEKVVAIKKLLDENKIGINGLVTGLSTSAEASRASIKQMNALELVSRRIDKIVEAISTVSIQTNMLAVNGAIEAARAGEFGKGFVVVATDIRNLAHDSSENADRIKDLVKAVQDQIGVVGRDLSEIVVAALSEVEKAKKTNIDLVSIETDILVVEKGAAEILAAIDEIASAHRPGEEGHRADLRRRNGSRQGSHRGVRSRAAAGQGSRGPVRSHRRDCIAGGRTSEPQRRGRRNDEANRNREKGCGAH